MTSPAEGPGPADSYARMRRNRRHPLFAGFASLYDFTLDDFQVRACRELEDGKGVLGKGKQR